MLKNRKWICGIVAALILLVTPMMGTATVEKIDKDTLILNGAVYGDDFKQFLEATNDPKIRHYEFLMHSPGGNAFTCMAIMNRMREMQREGITFTTKIYGIGMSAGTYIWLMGNDRVVYEGSSLLFHSIESQMNDYQIEMTEEKDPSAMAMIRRMDEWVKDRLRSMGMSETMIEYWMDSGAGQVMSAETARNTELATEYIPTD